ncbi:MAG: hypothetical protein NT136_03360 [Candidatus Moranbacteria bacterium]|nr:hypothetical protein [Candidatus Moranbacteria bacterium]
MKKKIIYFAIICAALIIQTSMLTVFFPDYQIPQIMLMLVIALTLSVGFTRALPWVILTGFAFDLVSYARIGTTVIIFVLISYAANFFYRRFLMENKGWGLLAIVLFVAAATVIHRMYLLFLVWAESSFQTKLAESGAFFGGLESEVFFNIILFFLCLLILKKIEKQPFFAYSR